MRSGTQQEVLTEKEVMSRKYNEQMQKQMGWNNPFEVGLAQEWHQQASLLLMHLPQHLPVAVSCCLPGLTCDS
jgi:hypothetical protein